ncbi:MAG: phosphoribosylaminoimidazole carboxylase ade2 [Bogoriella megaspora]|nr:MAG: phosphoribosylaminoimidazole carboxylase ade2 [Bogoriella megaspora]
MARLGILGGGQLGRMLLEEANRLNLPIVILDSPTAPAKQLQSFTEHVDGSFADPGAVGRLAEKCDLITIEIEHVDTKILEQVSKSGVRIEPSWSTIRTIQDKYEQKRHLQRHDIRTAEARVVDSLQDLENAAQELRYPLMLKARKQAYDGRGNFVVKSSADLTRAFTTLGSEGLYAEKWMKFKKELAVMVVKTKDNVFTYPTVETIQEHSVCKLVYAPAPGISDQVAAAAQDLAKRAVQTFEGKGVYGVELFLLEDDTLQVLEIAPRVHNSGHYTMDACWTSQFKAHLYAILDRPISEQDLRLPQPSIMLNILGGSEPQSHMALVEQADKLPGTRIHLYGKGDARPGRKMGHINIVRPSLHECEYAIAPLVHTANAIQSRRTDIDRTVPLSTATLIRGSNLRPRPALIGVIAGSKSDQPKLQPCYETLKRLGIPFERRICSAHRTPEYMASYAQRAAQRGIKVIVAAAGGAAHLPGMAAAFANGIPVVGLPIVPKVGDGWDSLVSMTSMPDGKPVLTVGQDKAVNAALGAAMIVAVQDEDARRELHRFKEEQKMKSLQADRELRADDSDFAEDEEM